MRAPAGDGKLVNVMVGVAVLLVGSEKFEGQGPMEEVAGGGGADVTDAGSFAVGAGKGVERSVVVAGAAQVGDVLTIDGVPDDALAAVGFAGDDGDSFGGGPGQAIGTGGDVAPAGDVSQGLLHFGPKPGVGIVDHQITPGGVVIVAVAEYAGAVDVGFESKEDVGFGAVLKRIAVIDDLVPVQGVVAFSITEVLAFLHALGAADVPHAVAGAVFLFHHIAEDLHVQLFPGMFGDDDGIARILLWWAEPAADIVFGADAVMIVEMTNYNLSGITGSSFYSGSLQSKATLYDSKGQAIWPMSGFGKSSTVGFDVESGGSDEAMKRLANASAHCIVRNLYNCPMDRYKIFEENSGEGMDSW